jgi:hypothetical protein
MKNMQIHHRTPYNFLEKLFEGVNNISRRRYSLSFLNAPIQEEGDIVPIIRGIPYKR